MPRFVSSRLLPWQACGLLVLLTIAVFGRVVGAQFLTWDDGAHVYRNSRFHPPTAQNIVRFWNLPFREQEKPLPGQDLAPYEQLWQPVPFTVWAVLSNVTPGDTAFKVPGSSDWTKQNPAVFHAANLTVHCLNVLLVFLLLRHLTGGILPSLLGSLAFAVHPVQTESVAWVTQLNNLLSTTFALAACLLFLRYLRDNTERQSATGGSSLAWFSLRYLGATLCFVLACLSKPGMVVLPLVAAVLAIGKYPPARRNALLSLLPWLVFALFVVGVNRGLQGAGDTGLYVTPWKRFFQAGDALTFYVWKLAVPYAQAVDYSRHSNYVLKHWWGYATWIVAVIIIVVAFARRRQWPEFARGVAIFVVGALPTIGLVPYYYHWFSTVSDRYIYFSMLGVALAIAGAVHHCSRWQKGPRLAVGGLYFVLVAWWCGQSWSDAGHWTDIKSLWVHVAQVTPRSWLARSSLANYYLETGELDLAARYFEESLQLNPGVVRTRYNYGLVLQRMGRMEDAVRQMETAHREAPADPDVINSLAVMRAGAGRMIEAEELWQRASELNPEDPQPLINMGVSLAMRKQGDKAIPLWRKALTLDPENAEVCYNLGIALEKRGELTEAIRLWRQALKYRPDYELATIALKRQKPEALQKVPDEATGP